MDCTKNKLGQRVKDLLENLLPKGKMEEFVANYCEHFDISQRTWYRRLEKGAFAPAELQYIAEKLGVDITFLTQKAA